MTPQVRKWVQIGLAVALVLALVRAAYIFWTRHTGEPAARQEKQAAPPLPADYYVTPKKLYAYDLASARALTQQPVYVREGYRYVYYPYDPARKRADLGKEAGTLPPIERLNITDVVQQPTPGAAGQQQVLAVFEKDGSHYALPVGIHDGSDYQIFADEILYLEDPRQLYSHWPQDVWQAIERGEVRKGMNELQVAFAAGMGIPQRTDSPEIKTVRYPRGGAPLTVTFRGGRAIEVLEEKGAKGG